MGRTTATPLRWIAVLCAATFLAAPAWAQAIRHSTQVNTEASTVGPGVGSEGHAQERLHAEVFANSDVHVTSADRVELTVHRMDTIELLEHELSQNLPRNEAEAGPVVKARIKAMGQRFAQRTRSGQEARMAARSYGVTNVPAVVINGGWVVYGTADVDGAIGLFQAGRAVKLTNKRPNPLRWGSKGDRP